MKVCHFGVFSPSQSGQYETAKELIMAERLVGIEAIFVDFGWADKAETRIGLVDGELKTVPQDYAYTADILLRHSDIPKKIIKSGAPYALCLHGRPEASFISGYREDTGVYDIINTEVEKGVCKGYICFWKEYMDFWKDMIPEDKLKYVSIPVDLKKYNPEGIKHNFKNPGSPNIIVVDLWRDDVTPFNVITAAIYYKRNINPDASIHIYGIWKNDYRRKFLQKFIDSGIISSCNKFVKGLEYVYRAADIMVSPHVISTRTVREALASGCTIVGGQGNPYTEYQHDPRDWVGFAEEIDRCWRDINWNGYAIRKRNRDIAEANFSFYKTGIDMKQAIGEIL